MVRELNEKETKVGITERKTTDQITNKTSRLVEEPEQISHMYWMSQRM